MARATRSDANPLSENPLARRKWYPLRGLPALRRMPNIRLSLCDLSCIRAPWVGQYVRFWLCKRVKIDPPPREARRLILQIPQPKADAVNVCPRLSRSRSRAADSSAGEPRLAAENDEYVLYLPVAMARVIMDKLPGFEPFQLSSWPAATVATIVSENPDAALASVVLGDFNGDSKTDVAMHGNAGRIGATFMLLAKSDSVPSPSILFIDRGDANKPTGNSYISLLHGQKMIDPLTQEVFDLRTDAVHLIVIDKASVLYYLDRGVIREYTTSD